MFKSKNLMLFVMLFILVAAIPTMALTNGSTHFYVSDKLVVGGAEIQSGDYDVKWESGAQGVTVTFLNKGKTAATAQGKVVGKDKKSEQNALLIMKDPSDRKALKEIRLSGKSDVIVFE